MVEHSNRRVVRFIIICGSVAQTTSYNPPAYKTKVLEYIYIDQWFSNFEISRSSLYSVYKWNQMALFHLVPFIHCQSYRLVRVNLDPPKGSQRVPGIHFENRAT